MNTIKSKYNFAAISVDIVVFAIIENELNALLIKMKKHPYEKHWAFPGGLIGVNESLECGAERILFTLTNLKEVYLEQLYTFGAVDRDPSGRVVSVAYMGLLSNVKQMVKTSKNFSKISFFPVIKTPLLAYDHDEVLKLAQKRLERRLGYTNIARSLLPKEFTLADLQKIYEIIWKKRIDKRNFRKKILSLGIIKRAGKKDIGKKNRPAELYTFSEQKNVEIKIV